MVGRRASTVFVYLFELIFFLPWILQVKNVHVDVVYYECCVTFMSSHVIHITRTYMYPSFCSLKHLGQPAQQLFWRCVNRSKRRESTKQRVVRRGFFKIKGLQVSIPFSHLTTPYFIEFLLSLQFMHGHNAEKLFIREHVLHRLTRTQMSTPSWIE